MRQPFRIYAIIAMATLAIACNRNREGVIKAAGQPRISVTDDELAKYVVWWRDYLEVGNRNVVEMNAVSKRVASKYSFADTGRIAQDPELLAASERQRNAMKEVMNRMPVDGVKMDALGETVPGVATLEFQGDKVVYVPGRNEIALAAARKNYGDQFVDWIVARESTIARILSQ
jgi:hypothetical protein